jgi:twitching motility protein PilJ
MLSSVRSSSSLSNDQKDAVAETANSLTHVEQQLQSLAQDARETQQLSKISKERTAEGGKTVQESLKDIQGIREKVTETSDRVLRLRTTSEQIAGILGTIREIAEKTNVLAINANLEAARAGAAGKGFTVVARSVQELAKQASEATTRVGALIEAVQSDIEAAAKSMGETAVDMQEAARKSEMAGESFIEIEEVAEALADAIEQMQRKTLEQAEQSSTIHQQMNRVVEMATRVASKNVDSQTTADELAVLAKQLIASTEKFKL